MTRKSELDVILLQGAINISGRRTVSLHRLQVRPSLPEVCSDPGTDPRCAALVRGIEAQVPPASCFQHLFLSLALCSVLEESEGSQPCWNDGTINNSLGALMQEELLITNLNNKASPTTLCSSWLSLFMHQTQEKGV